MRHNFVPIYIPKHIFECAIVAKLFVSSTTSSCSSRVWAALLSLLSININRDHIKKGRTKQARRIPDVFRYIFPTYTVFF